MVEEAGIFNVAILKQPGKGIAQHTFTMSSLTVIVGGTFTAQKTRLRLHVIATAEPFYRYPCSRS